MISIPDVFVQMLPHGRGLPLPTYATEHAAGLDLRAAIDHVEVIHPGCRVAIPTGIAVAIPVGFEAQIRPRSGLALKYGVTVLNSPGTIDADYRGEILVVLINHGDAAFDVARGERIAQIVFAPVCQANLQVVENLPDSVRGKRGFGSSGRK